MVKLIGTFGGRTVTAEVHGAHDVRGDASLLAAAVGLINLGHRVNAGPPLGGGVASFEDERIALATLAECCDHGPIEFEGLDMPLEDGADG